MQKSRLNYSLKSILILILVPVITGILMELVCFLFFDTHLIKTTLDIKNYIRSSGVSACTAFALSYNVTSGRMDLSLGAQRMLATILGGNIALQLGLGGIGVILFAIFFGMVFGTLIGTVFVVLRVPPMVLGIGMGLIYECIAFTYHHEGLLLTGMPNV